MCVAVPAGRVLGISANLLEAELLVDCEHRRIRAGVIRSYPLRLSVELMNVAEHRRLDPLAQSAAPCVRPHPAESLLDDGRPLMRQAGLAAGGDHPIGFS